MLLYPFFMGLEMATRDPVRNNFYERYAALYRIRKKAKLRGWSFEERIRRIVQTYVYDMKFPSPHWAPQVFFSPFTEDSNIWAHYGKTSFIRKQKKLLNRFQLERYQRERQLDYEQRNLRS